MTHTSVTAGPLGGCDSCLVAVLLNEQLGRAVYVDVVNGHCLAALHPARACPIRACRPAHVMAKSINAAR